MRIAGGCVGWVAPDRQDRLVGIGAMGGSEDQVVVMESLVWLSSGIARGVLLQRCRVAMTGGRAIG